MTDIEQAERENAVARAEADKKHAKVVPINPAEIVDDSGNAIDLSDTAMLRNWLLSKYQGKIVEVVDDEKTVVFYRQGLESSVKKRGDVQRQMYAGLESLVKNGIYTGYELGDKKHPTVERQNIYYSAAKIGNNIYGVRLKVDVFRGVSVGQYKDHKIAALEIEKSPFLYAGFDPYQQNGDFSIAVPNIRQAFINKGTTINLKSQEKAEKL